MDIPLIVSEIFGPTIQGEGPSTGTLAYFLRLGGCPLSCVWCDTKYTWDWSQYDSKEELLRMEVAEVADKLIELGLSSRSPLLVITGGEPMVQQPGIDDLLAVLEARDMTPGRIEIETAGIRPPMDYLSHRQYVYYNVSPKLEGSGNSLASRYRPEALRALLMTDRAIFKFVIESHDPQEILNMRDIINIPDEKIWIQPEGITSKKILEGLQEYVELALGMGWNLSPRLHTLIWGNRRGV